MSDNVTNDTDQAHKHENCPVCGRRLPEPGTLFMGACGTCLWGTEDGGGVPCRDCGTTLDPSARGNCCRVCAPDLTMPEGRVYWMTVQPGYVVQGLYEYLSGMAADDHPVDPEEMAAIKKVLYMRDLMPVETDPEEEVRRWRSMSPRLH
ncbi:hypothetical protein O7626_14395 [Micromonospora sp. WMMD1102]|uniref:hypothetical protein n=1 Tax=Micromonospora sp. WMMD1102 TaxID=3016105 RepID=UPI00241519D9|nr:hypothetical protein [Micromonospora sp. WMMD1102]MDG4787104.1 hypothetical protein [Micromonospora sp. WMMD1102]